MLGLGVARRAGARRRRGVSRGPSSAAPDIRSIASTRLRTIVNGSISSYGWEPHRRRSACVSDDHQASVAAADPRCCRYWPDSWTMLPRPQGTSPVRATGRSAEQQVTDRAEEPALDLGQRALGVGLGCARAAEPQVDQGHREGQGQRHHRASGQRRHGEQQQRALLGDALGEGRHVALLQADEAPSAPGYAGSPRARCRASRVGLERQLQLAQLLTLQTTGRREVESGLLTLTTVLLCEDMCHASARAPKFRHPSQGRFSV